MKIDALRRKIKKWENFKLLKLKTEFFEIILTILAAEGGPKNFSSQVSGSRKF